MATDSVRAYLSAGVQALVNGEAERALESLNLAAEADPDNPEVLSMRGLALAQTGRLEEATSSLRRSVMLAPNTGRFFYNYAVHLRDLGDTETSIEMAREAHRLDPRYPGVIELCQSLGIEVAPLPGFSIRNLFIPPTRAAIDPALGRPPHSIPALEHAQREWTLLGWTVAALTIVGPILFRVHFPFHEPGPGESKGIALVGGALLNHDALSVATMFMFVSFAILSWVWTFIDCLDRRSRALWFVPMVLFCLCGVPGVAQAMYMAAGRR